MLAAASPLAELDVMARQPVTLSTLVVVGYSLRMFSPAFKRLSMLGLQPQAALNC